MAFNSWLYLSACLSVGIVFSGAEDSTEKKTTCFAPPAYLGEPGSLTCFFDVDVTTLDPRPSFSVRKAGHDFDYNRDTVLDCDWRGTQLNCMKLQGGYRFDQVVSKYLTLIINNVTEEDAGEYYCQLILASGAGEIERCNLTVSERPEPPPTKKPAVTVSSTVGVTQMAYDADAIDDEDSGLNILVIIVPVVAVVVLVVIAVAVVCVCRRKRNSDSFEVDKENPLTHDQAEDIEAAPEPHESTQLNDRPQQPPAEADDSETTLMLNTAPDDDDDAKPPDSPIISPPPVSSEDGDSGGEEPETKKDLLTPNAEDAVENPEATPRTQHREEFDPETNQALEDGGLHPPTKRPVEETGGE